MAEKLHEQQDQLRRRDDESPADHDPVTQIQEHEILNLSETNISVPEPLLSESSMSMGSFDDGVILEVMCASAPKPSYLRSETKTSLSNVMCAPEPSYLRPETKTSVLNMNEEREWSIIIVTPRQSTIETYPNMKNDEETFDEEAAVCKFCFGKFEQENMFMTRCNCEFCFGKFEPENMHMTKCNCKFCFGNYEPENLVMTKCNCPKPLLIHEDCIPKSATKGNNKCKVCGREVMSFAVEISSGSESNNSSIKTPTPKQRKRDRLLKRLGCL